MKNANSKGGYMEKENSVDTFLLPYIAPMTLYIEKREDVLNYN